MSKQPRKAIEFVEAALTQAKQLQERQATAATTSIWGGVVAADKLPLFLQAWDEAGGQLAYGMVEEVGRFYALPLTKFSDVLPAEPLALERARLFGEQGDLDLRRDGDSFRWRFIGEVALKTPDLQAWQGEDYWATHPHDAFYLAEKAYTQWLPGDLRINEEWYEGIGLTKKSSLRQIQYLDNGRIAFARYMGFEEMS
jgi:hypothetical protein